MENNICKSCGGALERQGNINLCKYCGHKWIIDVAEDIHTVERANAWSALKDCDFERAAEKFENIIFKDPNDFEAHWGLALAASSIQYVTDLNENKMVPTCNNISEARFFDSKHVQKAISLAPKEISDTYKEQAERIEAVRLEWLKKAKNEKPYEVFICFKDSDRENNIERTQDSLDAHELYNALTEEGYRVFFSRASLRNKTSEHFEPYIYNALRTAKVMIVFGEKPEYFNAVWVKNEWSRFRAMIERGDKAKNSLVVVYKNMDPADLPVGLRSRQCIDAGEMMFYDTLKHHIEKIVNSDKNEPVIIPPVAPPTYTPPAKPKRKVFPTIAVIAAVLALSITLGFTLPNLLSGGGGTQNDSTPSTNENIAEDNSTEAPTSESSSAPTNSSAESEFESVPVTEEEQSESIGGNTDVTETDTAESDTTESDTEETENRVPESNASKGLEFTSNGNGTCYLSGIGTCTDVNVIIPSYSASGDRVIKIGERAFASNEDIESVFVPKTVETLGLYCFNYCKYLESVTLSEGLKTIEGGAFMGSAIKEIVIPDSVTSIQTRQYHPYTSDVFDAAFENCSKLTSVTIGNKVTTIEKEAFMGCTSLSTVVIGERVESIGVSAFAGCSALKNVTMGTGVKIISENAFSQCSLLASIELGSEVTEIRPQAFMGCSSLESINIPGSVLTIGYDCFKGCTNLETVTLNEGLKTIEGGAFMSSGIKEIVIPNSVTSLQTRQYHPYNADVFDGAFESCSKLTSVTIGNKVTAIEKEAFMGCTSLSSVVIGKRVESIAASAFAGCTSLGSINIPESVQTIGINCFKGCESLENVTFNEGLKTIEGGAFMGCPVTEIVIPNSVTTISTHYYRPSTISYYDGAFEGCTKLTTITLGKALEKIETDGFKNCTSLTAINFGGSKSDWEALTKETDWNASTGAYTVHCNDGDIAKATN